MTARQGFSYYARERWFISISYKVGRSCPVTYFSLLLINRTTFLFLLLFLTQYLHRIFCVYVTRTTPNSRSSNQVPRTISAITSSSFLRQTYCMAVIATLTSTVKRGVAVAAPIKASCRAVLYLLMVVGWTSADGSEKSQYRIKVLGGGREIQRK